MLGIANAFSSGMLRTHLAQRNKGQWGSPTWRHKRQLPFRSDVKLRPRRAREKDIVI